MIAFFCVNCGQRIEADDSAAGYTGQCPYCQGEVTIPYAVVPPAPSVPHSLPAIPPPSLAGPVPSAYKNPAPQGQFPPVPAQAWAPPPLVPSYLSQASPPPALQSQPRRRPFIKSAIFSTVLCVPIMFMAAVIRPPSLFGAPSMAEALGATTGFLLAAMLTAAVIAALLGALLMLAKIRFLRTFTLAYSIVVLLVSLNNLRIQYQPPSFEPAAATHPPASTFTADLNSIVNEVASQVQDSIADPARRMQIQAPPAVSPGQNDEQKVVAIFRIHAQELADCQNEYHVAVENAGWGRLLVAKRLAADVEMAESYKILEDVQRAITLHEAKNLELLLTPIQRLQNSGFSAEFQKLLIDDYQKGLVTSRATVVEIWRIEAQIVNNVRQLIEFLHAKQGFWSASDQEVLFSSAADLATFNAYMQKTGELYDSQTKLRQAAIDSARAGAQ